MMAAFIFVVSLVTLLMFFVSYCRSLDGFLGASHCVSQKCGTSLEFQRRRRAETYARVMQLL